MQFLQVPIYRCTKCLADILMNTKGGDKQDEKSTDLSTDALQFVHPQNKCVDAGKLLLEAKAQSFLITV